MGNVRSAAGEFKVTRPIPSIDLHTHLRGAITPSMARSLASKHGLPLDESIFDKSGEIVWNGFAGFLDVYASIATTVRDTTDLYVITVKWLKRIAAEGTIYTELMLSPAHVEQLGIPIGDQLSAIAEGIDAASEFGIQARIVATCIRHHGPAEAERITDALASRRWEHVVGFGLTGDEHRHEPEAFAKAFQIAAGAGLGCTAHTGEWRGARSVAATVKVLGLQRIGHGIRAVESLDVLNELVNQGVGWEICLSSNLRLKYSGATSDHPLPKLIAAGCKVALGTDDPAFFRTSPHLEYELARQAFRLSEAELVHISRDAVDIAFCDMATKKDLHRQISEWCASNETTD